jgi:crotonobetainyl-CoA:carnitine CoA-transferase CaiB-like acyl-CoA transferase
MLDCQIALLENAVMRYTTSGEVPGPVGARHPTITPFAAFKTSDGDLIIAAGNDSLFIKLADALGRKLPGANIDIFDRLPTPFGLVRGGVAPDHQGTKNIARQFERTARERDAFVRNSRPVSAD